MASITQLLNTMRDALAAQSAGLGVTSQNVANVNTPGYARRSVVLEPKPYGTGALGGVDTAGIQRAADRFLEQRFFEASGLSSAASERDQQLGGVEALFNDAQGSGIGSSLDSLFNAFSSLARTPNDPTARQTVLADADAFASQVRSTGDALAELRSGMLDRAGGTATEINQDAQKVADLNGQIAVAVAAGANVADLEDLRNQVLLGMSNDVDIKVFVGSDGNMVVQAGGATLVDGSDARTLGVSRDSSGALKVFASRSGGGPSTDITAQVVGGTLGGVVEADADAGSTAARLDQFTFDVANAVNAQHAAGVGLDGVGGRALFSVSGPQGAARSIELDAAIAGHPDWVAAASSASSLPGGSDNAVTLSMLSSKPVAASGTRTAGDEMAALVGDVGQKKSASAASVQARDGIKAQVEQMKESVTGVSLDEEMVSLTKYQQAYQASSKVITTLDDLLQDLMTRLGK